MLTNQNNDNPNERNYSQETHTVLIENLVYVDYRDEAKENINTKKYEENCNQEKI
jgi:hypothetical protein